MEKMKFEKTLLLATKMKWNIFIISDVDLHLKKL